MERERERENVTHRGTKVKKKLEDKENGNNLMDKRGE